MTADLVLTETAAASLVAGVYPQDAARPADLTFISIHTPCAVRPGRSCF